MRILVVGREGMLSQELVPYLQHAGFEVFNEGLPRLDITKKEKVYQSLQDVQPQVVINAAAFTDVDQAESDREIAFAVNRDGPKHLAQFCHRVSIPLIHVSTDYVFDGSNTRPYRENDRAQPASVYGKSKWEGEEVIRSVHGKHIIIRTAWLYSLYGRNFLKTILRLAGERRELQVINDQHGCPTWAKDFAGVLTKICHRIEVNRHDDGPWGTYHYCGEGETTWFGMASVALQSAKQYTSLQVEQVHPIATEDYRSAARRPAYSVLNCSKIKQVFNVQPIKWVSSVQRCVGEFYAC